MAVTSIWSIKGWIGKVIKYAENPDKTKENNEGQISENQSQSTQGLTLVKRVLEKYDGFENIEYDTNYFVFIAELNEKCDEMHNYE